MKNRKVVASAAVATAVATVAGLAPVLADSPGQLQGGSITYQVKDITQNGTYSNSISANACDELQYRVDLHNTEFSALNGIVVKVTLPSSGGTSNMTATTSAGGSTGTSGSATVNLSSGSMSYETGSTQLFDGNDNLVKSLPDGIANGGVNVGTLNGSTTEYLKFKAKVGCPTTPNTPQTPSTPSTTSALPQTGPESAAAGALGATALSSAALAYRRSRRALSDAIRRK